MEPTLFTPLQAGDLHLPNRIVMAAMTRSRADDRGAVGPLTARYYAQRASAGLVVTEGLYPDPMGKGYVRTPGIADEGHVAAWREVTRAVHAAGGRIAAQVMHAGRISDPSFLPGGATPVAPSAVRPEGSSYTDQGPRPHVTPRALSTPEVQAVIESHARAAGRALRAGFDGVELHAGSGYLPMQFLASSTNHRTDAYGGNLHGRLRFVLECVEAMVAVAGAGRVGIKLTPQIPFNGALDEQPRETYAALARALAARGLAFAEVVSSGPTDWHALLRPLLGATPYFRGGGLDAATAAAHLAARAADAAVFGQLFIANPDLPQRFAAGAPLAAADADTFYTPGARGYVDYPSLPAVAA
ncbi:MAG TPA: alkene reductase [Ramlibacter sp.]|nr:alkene reductase [Ramlibacter sp.]